MDWWLALSTLAAALVMAPLVLPESNDHRSVGGSSITGVLRLIVGQGIV